MLPGVLAESLWFSDLLLNDEYTSPFAEAFLHSATACHLGDDPRVSSGSCDLDWHVATSGVSAHTLALLGT